MGYALALPDWVIWRKKDEPRNNTSPKERCFNLFIFVRAGNLMVIYSGAHTM